MLPSRHGYVLDGSIVIGGNSDPIFKRLMLAIEREDLANDPSLAHNDGRVPRTLEIDAAIATWLATRTIDEALDVLNAADVPVGRIYSVADMFTDPQFMARQMIQRFKWQDGKEITLPSVTPKLSETPGETRWLGPELGEHTDEVLRSLGYDDEQIASLHAQQIV
jgi:formyl-CoA transferase